MDLVSACRRHLIRSDAQLTHWRALSATCAVSGAHHWYPDLDYARSFGNKIYFFDSEREQREIGHLIPEHRPIPPEPQPEKYVKNLQLNFGPQHPAAHGVLRLVLQLDGEVQEQYSAT